MVGKRKKKKKHGKYMIVKEISGISNMKKDIERKEHDHLVSERIAAITRWIGNLQIVDRLHNSNEQSRINQRSSSRQVRESGFERHLAALQNKDRVQEATAAADWRTEELRKKRREREARRVKNEELSCSFSFRVVMISLYLNCRRLCVTKHWLYNQLRSS